MDTALASPLIAPRTLWTGRILTGLVVAFLLFDGLMKVIAIAPVVEGTTQLGYATSVIRPLGVLLTTATLLHVIPRTQLLGALLVTAYLGGATATLVRAGTPFWFPIVMGAVLWAGFYLRNPRVRALILSSQTR